MWFQICRVQTQKSCRYLAEKNAKLAGQAFGWHKQVGQAYELFVPLHVGAVGLHALKGQNIMRRMGVTVFG